MAELRVVSAGDFVNWYKGGWKIFKADMANWVLMTLLFLVIVFVLAFIPFLGQVVLFVLIPLLTGGMWLAAQKVDQGRQITVMDLFSMFKDEQRRIPLIILGLIMLVVAFLNSMIVGGTMMASMTPMAGGDSPMMPTIGMGGFLVALAGSLLLAMLFMFATLLVVFKNQSPIDAIKNSFMASVKNFAAFILFFLSYLGLVIVAAIPFGLGFLVLVPVMIAAVYVAYKNILA